MYGSFGKLGAEWKEIVLVDILYFSCLSLHCTVTCGKNWQMDDKKSNHLYSVLKKDALKICIGMQVFRHPFFTGGLRWKP